MMRYKLVIAEKPSVAQSLAAVIGATARKDGYLEGNGWRVSWCVGHLAGLADADSYLLTTETRASKHQTTFSLPVSLRQKIVLG